MYVRSLLVLRALTDRRTGAVAAGARDGWAYVRPRDASAVAIALASAGYRPEARRVVHFLRGLDLEAAARFHGDRTPVDGRAAQGDAAGWVAAAARAADLPPFRGSSADQQSRSDWRDKADYQEGSAGDYLANAIASSWVADGPETADIDRFQAHRRGEDGIRALFATSEGLLARRAGDPGSGVDSTVAWAVRPFPHPALFPLIRRSLHRLLEEREGRFGIVPSEDWPGADPWTAPTAWTAWALAALATTREPAASSRRDRRGALRLLGDLRRAATPAGMLPERVDARTGIPRSTTPLAWSHAFAILAIRALWP